ncbi:hypothetical protein SASPL_101271 [Salvia splendens]|uniref:Uncharacterized protein n=1 Tax=Salvia splendens TaxID=180675 RepID=A0A8X8YRK4_SALSN|nr:hypothetical protein SASPL_101271 [Salvia splendens]
MASDQSKLDLSETSSDLPPESFYVPSDDEYEWFDRNAVMQRKSSLKIGYNRNFTSFSHRSTVVSHQKPSVFALPKVQKTGRAEPGRWLFRSRSESGGKAAIHAAEPASPRVSCTGRVGFKSGDGKKTGLARIFSSIFGTRTGRSRSQRRGNGPVELTGRLESGEWSNGTSA